MLKLLKRTHEHDGFTLLELLMVVIILAILASIALPQYIRAAEKARSSEALQLLGSIRSAQDRYRAMSPSNLATNSILDLDAEMPAVTRAWGTGSNGSYVTFSTTSASLTRSGGAYANQVLGIIFANGALCGNFAPMGTGLGNC